ncbi:translesion error-prone DNA polymerase V autoproteolytic subunit [Pseudoalteromonas sp. C2R02]|uniref:LexA family protein n=1 Tax=Pseudoalteromonas sp. C2R02 TaxID=2841565 RepID=UPI001C09361F|nr:translesion error-prone DNA polymerase V autoproteolytic subunit [Pseudoalteromonas sp. C2R02]MBU2968753.1 translesion error-prone DNA polymerase V autoproteolytic subunit [Pseudoalteromonas sp. C2R02]
MKLINIKVDAGMSGFESPAAEYKELGLSLDSLLIDNPDATFLAVANGHSMTGCGIMDGDLLIIDRSKKPFQNCIVIAVMDGCFICKILDEKNMQLVSASADHKPIKITPESNLTFEGVVTRSIRMHQPAPELFR